MDKRKVVKAKKEDLPVLLEIYEAARKFMRRSGNMTQWQGGFPPAELLLSDIEIGQLYVIKEEDKIIGVFALIFGKDPTYSYIEDGAWLSTEAYATLHRVASDGLQKGILEAAVNFAWKQIRHLRIDTHRDNLPMQRAIQKNGFKRCGIIYLPDGSPRIVFEKIENPELE